jgi:hypothetical protein
VWPEGNNARQCEQPTFKRKEKKRNFFVFIENFCGMNEPVVTYNVM